MPQQYDGSLIKISVPATSANLGAGFDCAGLALDLYNDVYVGRRRGGLYIETDDDLPRDGRNLVVRTMKMLYARKNVPFSGVFLRQVNRIPKTSGLGSSAACVVAGLLAADALLGTGLSKQELLDLATKIDGHPDNVAPALSGGIATSLVKDGHVISLKVMPKGDIKVALLTPDFALSTKTARGVLPHRYSREDVVYNIGHATLTYAALSLGRYDVLDEVVGDKIHEPYRRPLIPGFEQASDYLRAIGGFGVYLSGAGPTLAAFVKPDAAQKIPATDRPPEGWTLRIADICENGAAVEK
ncbi:MAG: homoserine kinase [Clostridiales bacterium]|jgi:homoserine kinase|nr:homoserine kinase [Clostridiales bacterium]